MVYIILGNKEKALESLSKESESFLDENLSIYLWLKNDPIYDEFRNEPLFREILQKHKDLYELLLEKYGEPL